MDEVAARACTVALALLGATALVGAPAVRASAQTDDARLEALRSAWVAAYETGDADAMGDLYTPDAVRMPYDAPAVQGRAGIVAAYRSNFANRRLRIRIELIPLGIEFAGELAVERGRYDEEWTTPEGEVRIRELGKYVSILRRGGDGRWRYAISIFNRDAASGAAAGPGGAD